MAIQGLRGTGNFATDERPQNWREGILHLFPNGNAPLTALTKAMKKRVVDDYTFNWWDKVMDSRRIEITASLNATDTTTIIAVNSNGLSVKRGDVLVVEHTDEILWVSADPIADTGITVTRGFAGSTKTALTIGGAGINPHITVIGSAYEEASGAPTGVNFDPVKRTNLTQIFRNTLEMSNTAIETRLRTGEAVKEAKRETLEIHSSDMERAFWEGRQVDTTLNGKPLHTMNGIMRFIDSGNIKTVTTDYPSGLTMSGLEEYMYNIFKWGSNEKMAFGGNRALLTIQQILRKNATWNFNSGVKEFGMNVTRITSPFGELVFKNHPLFNRRVGGTVSSTAYYGLESWMFVLDMMNLKYVHLKNRDTKYEPKLQDNGLDGLKSGYITEPSIEVHHPTTHYLLKNVAVSAAG